MATVSFLWHLHQPAYRTADGRSHAPWAAIHAGGAYTTLARAIETTAATGQIVNIVPTLLEQLLAYSNGNVSDPVLDAVLTPATDLDDDQRETLVNWGFHVDQRQMARYPRLAELARRRPDSVSEQRLNRIYGPGDLRDLQVLFALAHAGEQAWSDPRLSSLHDHGRDFGADEHRHMAEWVRAQPVELIERWHRIAELPGVEIATSPFAHPILPLLIDTGVVEDSWSPHPPPEVPTFRHPEDAHWQLAEGLAFMSENGFETVGCWPPEGSVSAAAVEVYGEAGVRWLVTDEGILERSLDRPLRNGERTAKELYHRWRLENEGPVLFFRDRELSDAIGFEYGRWEDESRAAESLCHRLEALARNLPEDASIVIALDGENPWLHFPEGGGRFLRELMDRLNHSVPGLQPATLESIASEKTSSSLERLHPGSWINSIFATWIGHPEKTNAWRVLAEVRRAIEEDGQKRPPSLLLAEGSDWFWWLGDDNPTDLAPLYDQIFRHHLADACKQAGIEVPPVDLEQPLKVSGHAATEEPTVSELRYCSIKHRWTIIAPERRHRPGEGVVSGTSQPIAPENDPFARGNEDQTATEIFRLPKDAKPTDWQVRVFANSFPVLRVEGEVVREAVGLNDTVSGIGAHEVIVETPEAGQELADLDLENFLFVFQAYRARLLDLRRDPRLRYVLIFKNKGLEAGASVNHAHSQLIATPIIPTTVVNELNSCREHYNRRERCLFCDLIRQEQRLTERICLETDRYVAMAPFAAASPFETWILPKEHRHDFAFSTDDELRSAAVILRDFLRRVRTLLDDPPYNLVLHTAPNAHPRPGRPDYWATLEHDYHWHFEFAPRTTRLAGFEWGSGYTINPTPPEEAARLLSETDPDTG
jgi:UDPglucose--hexose-1-phosphate uridylyltransferase